MIVRILLFILFLFVIEWLALRGLLKVVHQPQRRKTIRTIYWLLALVMFVLTGAYYFYNVLSDTPDHIQFKRFFNLSALFVLNMAPKLILSLVSLIDDLLMFLMFLYKHIVKKNIGKRFSHVRFGIMTVGLSLAAFLVVMLAHGMIAGKNDAVVKHVRVASPHVPDAFDGFTIAQISDLHLGSYSGTAHVEKAVALLQELNPDVIVFTGDMVNNEAAEALPFVQHFAKLNPPYGMYSVLGNHDMGDYRRWYNEREKNCNLNELVRQQEAMGFRMLRNAHAYIVRGSDTIVMVGVDNWGEPPFKQYGDLSLALDCVSPDLFTVLLTHDPSHWRSEVLQNPRVNLSLSGHTHGFQFALNIAGRKISPVQLKYAEWGGLYSEGDQHLYVNTGYGFIGFPGRVGVPPEITLITLGSVAK